MKKELRKRVVRENRLISFQAKARALADNPPIWAVKRTLDRRNLASDVKAFCEYLDDMIEIMTSGNTT